MRQVRFFSLAFLNILLFGHIALAATYRIDIAHSTVSFKIRHLLSNVQGHFGQFEGSFEYDPAKPENWKTNATIQVASIDTNVEQRDKHLRSADFFDVEKFPKIEFKTTKVADATDKSLPAGQAGAKLEGV